MRVALLADIHANHGALASVLAACRAERVTRYVNLGDVVGYGPDPKKCVRDLRGMSIENVQGNHDAAVLGLAAGEASASTRQTWEFARSVLDADDLQFLGGFRDRVLIGETLLCAHGSPSDRDEYVRTRVGMRRLFSLHTAWLCAVGHTHRQYAFDGDRLVTGPAEIPLFSTKRYVFNPGSVGQPRDGDPRAAFAILDLESQRLLLRRAEYDVEATASRIIEAGLPGLFAERLRRAS